jgi:hypothetical protein
MMGHLATIGHGINLLNGLYLVAASSLMFFYAWFGMH